MALDPNIVQFCVDLRAATMILHISEMTITLLRVTMVLQEEILGQLKHDGKKHEQFPHDLIVDVLGEILDLIPMLPDQLGMAPFTLGDEFGDVVDLRVVFDAVLDLSETERFVAVVATMLEVGTVLELLLGRQVKNLLAEAELSVDLFLAEAEVGNIKEACGRQGS